MKTLSVEIKQIKGIKHMLLDIPLESGIYALVGSNGCGKSTILQALAQLIRPKNALYALRTYDYSLDAEVNFKASPQEDKWYIKNTSKGAFWVNNICQSYVGRKYGREFGCNNIQLQGMYEGSLFVGTRFQDSKKVDDLVHSGKIKKEDVVPADKYIVDQLSFILHGDYTHYQTLRRLRNRDLSLSLNLKNLPYFIESNYGGIISQYKMSSGECLLISLLHFIYNAIIRSSLPQNIPILMLLDEIELALHPVAVSRFLDLLEDIVSKRSNIIVMLTTHAPEVIRRIDPNNMFRIENYNGVINSINPCYPSYAIREIYTHDKYDYLVLCEDKLAKHIIQEIIKKNNLNVSKLIAVLPVGGWENVLKLHKELLLNNILGVGTKIISILDGDIKGKCQEKEEYNDLLKLFLPIPSIEKFLFNQIYTQSSREFKKKINDKYFQLKSLDKIIIEFNNENKELPTNPDKKFYRYLKDDLKSRKISEDVFIESLCYDIFAFVSFESFNKQLLKQF
jgi:energy-coupling factor transporter ATP-binding protein EcfA2